MPNRKFNNMNSISYDIEFSNRIRLIVTYAHHLTSKMVDIHVSIYCIATTHLTQWLISLPGGLTLSPRLGQMLKVWCFVSKTTYLS